MMVRTRKVTCLDAHTSIEHMVSVSAQTLYEAVAAALHPFIWILPLVTPDLAIEYTHFFAYSLVPP
jgi:hypothetical protein